MIHARHIRGWLLPLLLILATQLAIYVVAADHADAQLDHRIAQVAENSHGENQPDALIDLTPPEVRSLGGSSLAEHLHSAPAAVRALLPALAELLVDPVSQAPAPDAPRMLRLGRAPPR